MLWSACSDSSARGLPTAPLDGDSGIIGVHVKFDPGQGAAMSLEDVSVLARLLTAHETWDDDLLTGYWQRRLPRVRMVVDASVQLGQWLLDGVRDADVPGLIGATMAALKEQP